MTVATPIDPEAQRVLDQIAAQAARTPVPDHEVSESERVAGVRRAYAGAAQMAGAAEAVAHITDESLNGPNGSISVRIYQPPSMGKVASVLIWCHGGSFISGDLDTHDAPLRAIANRAGFPVVAVDWRLAPEHPYPAGLEDAFAVLQWAARGRDDRLGASPARIAIGGDSAGGALAAALTLLARDRGGPAIAAQVLVYPNTDLSGDGGIYPSWAQNDGRVLTRADMERNFMLYAAGADRAQQGISPIRAKDFSGLPRALLITAEADPQRDEGEAYGARLREAGVIVDHSRYPGMIHGFLQMAGVLQPGRALIDEIGGWLAPLSDEGISG